MSINFNHYLPSGAELHQWQTNFLEKFTESAALNALKPNDQREAFILNATPSAGKSWAQMVAIKHLLDHNIIDLAVVIVPTVKLKDDFGDEAQNLFGLLTHAKRTGVGNFSPAMHQVLVITYGQLQHNKQRLKEICQTNRVMVSADEMHHLSERQSWGKHFLGGFEEATVRLLTTGTPFRSDGGAMPWVRLTPDNRIDLTGRHAYSYPYGGADLCALRDGVATPVVFHPWDGEVRFADAGGEERSHKLTDNLDEIYKDELSPLEIKRLKTYRRQCILACGSADFPEGTEYVKSQITSAHKKLNDIRSEHAHASGMIICMDRKHADAVAKATERLTGTKPVVVHGDEPNYQQKLKAFQQDYSPSRAQWLISVNMVSEGVNVNHMRVLVYMTDVTAPMRWMQIIGRVMRYDKTVREIIPFQEGHVYQYDDGFDNDEESNQVTARLKLYAESILEEKEFTIRRIEEEFAGITATQEPEIEGSLSSGADIEYVQEGEDDRINLLQNLMRNLGATGFQTHQLYEGEYHDVQDLDLFKPMVGLWGMCSVACKSYVDKMTYTMREFVYNELRQKAEESSIKSS